MGTFRPASRRSGGDAERTSPSGTPGSVDRLRGARRGATPRAPCAASGARSARLGLGRSGRFGAARSAVARHRPPAADAALDPGPVRIRPSRACYAAPARSRLVEPRPEPGRFLEACDAWPVRTGTACDPAEPSRRRSRPCPTRAGRGPGRSDRRGPHRVAAFPAVSARRERRSDAPGPAPAGSTPVRGATRRCAIPERARTAAVPVLEPAPSPGRRTRAETWPPHSMRRPPGLRRPTPAEP
jgi:hypothetical protein